jgi:acyl-CoA thioester hydrolase
MDQLRHVNNVTYADYLQEARIDFFRSLEMEIVAHGAGGAQVAAAQSEDAFGIVVVRHEITYLAPLHFDYRTVSIETWVTRIGAASFEVAYEVFRDDQPETRTVFLRATTRLAPFVFGAERPRRLTPAERAVLAPFVEEPEARAAAPHREPVPHDAVGHYPVHVRFSDLDPYGHVNNVIFLEYFQEGRVFFHGRLWHDLPSDTPRTGLVVAQLDCDYLRPLVARPDGYDLWTSVRHVGGRSVVLDAEICEPGTTRVAARSSAVLVFYDTAAGRSVEPPEAYRAPFVEIAAARAGAAGSAGA